MVPPLCGWLLALASQLVPEFRRVSWRKDWEGRTWYAGFLASRAGRSAFRVSLLQLFYALRAFPDAVWQKFDRQRTHSSLQSNLRRPLFCILALCFTLLLVLLTSNGMTRTIRAVAGPKYQSPDRILTMIVQESFLGKQSGVRPEWIGQWRANGHTVEQIAYYNLRGRYPRKAPMPEWAGRHAVVSANFFQVLGVNTASGHPFEAGDETKCLDCAVITERFRKQVIPSGGVGSTVMVEGRPFRVSGVLPADFWFLSDDVAAFTLERPPLLRRAVAIARLAPGATTQQAQAELQQIAGAPNRVIGSTLVDKLRSPLQRYTSGSLFLFCGVLIVALAGLVRHTGSTQYWSFFAFKNLVLLSIVLLFTIEHTGAGSLSVTAGSRFEAETIALWFWSVANSLTLWWSLKDQRRRCRICLRVLIRPVRIGIADRVLFDHGATETICPGGHGTLFVEDTTDTFRQSGRWRELDESWRELFVSSQKDD